MRDFLFYVFCYTILIVSGFGLGRLYQTKKFINNCYNTCQGEHLDGQNICKLACEVIVNNLAEGIK